MKDVLPFCVFWIAMLGLVDLGETAAIAQDSAPSSHMVFDDNFPGDILINEVRVPTSGEAMYTYYETLGWRGKGAGYAGVQAHPKSHLYIFSIWDNKAHTSPIKAVYAGAGTKVEGFGGEGTGLKSWNFDLGWSNDVWYTLVARTWPVDDHTYFGYWVRDTKTGQWTHLVTMDVAAQTSFEGGTDAFIEDWLSTGVNRRVSHLRGGWKRKLDGSWHAFGKCRYSVNAWDLEKGKRSFNYQQNWNGGVRKDAESPFYFMASGGKTTQPTATNPSNHAIERDEVKPDYERISAAIKSVQLNGNELAVAWEVDRKQAPQFSYRLQLASPEKVLVDVSERTPQARKAKLDVTRLAGQLENTQLKLICTDILDRSVTVTAAVQP